MITKLTTLEELKKIWVEILFNKTSKVTKISDESTLNGIAYGCAKIGQKALKDIAILESHIFPDSAYGQYLDNIAQNFGIAPRFGSSESQTFVRLVGNPGTQYLKNVNSFTSKSGIIFTLIDDIILNTNGYGYYSVRSQTKGLITNVDPLSIDTISAPPSGHSYVINEFRASGGRDEEDDITFRNRIKQGVNVLARGTIAMLEQVFMKINNNVLRIIYQGVDVSGKYKFGILTQNGILLTTQELQDLLEQGEQYLSLCELTPQGYNSLGIILTNIDYYYLDISFRCELFTNYNIDDIRKEIQIKFMKKYDFRYFDWNLMKIEWDDLLQLVKETRGVKYIYDQYFYPRVDISIPKYMFPKFRSFLMLDKSGNLISTNSNTINPVYYPNQMDWSYQSSVLRTII